MKKVLFISGSLRKDSFNTQLLKIANEMIKNNVETSFLSYSEMPFMNQDDEFKDNAYIKKVRAEVKAADAIFIASPEYNHSYSGVLKNLLDWLSRPTVAGDYKSAVIRGKIVAISSLAGSSKGSFSLAKLKELLEMLSCTVCESETKVALNERFSTKELVLTEDEMNALKAECKELLERLK